LVSEAVQSRVERALIDAENISGKLPDSVGDGETMHGTDFEDLEN
jgi:hypothetical protein